MENSSRSSDRSAFSRLKSSKGGFLLHTRHHNHILSAHSKLLQAVRSLLHLLRPGQKQWRRPAYGTGGAPPFNDDWSHNSSGNSSFSAPSTSGAAKSVVTGTLYGQRNSRIHFAIQEEPRATPTLLLELAMPTNTLVKQMASGLVKIALECSSSNVPASADHVLSSIKNRSSVFNDIDQQEQKQNHLFQEPSWTMYCNGRETGFSYRRDCSAADMHVLSLVQVVSMGAGILPAQPQQHEQQLQDNMSNFEQEILYMRSRFERAVGSKDSEAFYMMNPDGNGGPELSIFLLRIT